MAVKPQYEVAHIIQKNWDSIVNNAQFNTHQIRMLNAVRACRTAELGWHIDECESCGHLHLSYNSCRNRHCPKCQGKLREDWIRAQHKKLLPVKYFHVVFTIPDSLNGLCLHQPKMMYSILFKAAWYTIKTFAADHNHLGAQTGMTAILHTWGQNLSLHPHLHCVIPAGGMTKHKKWNQAKSKGKFLFPVKAMSVVFRARFVHLLRKEAKTESVTVSSSFYDQLFKKKWVVFAKQPFLGAAQIIEYIGRYTHKIAISNHRIRKVENGKVYFQYKDYRQNAKKLVMALDEMEFVRRFSLHILPLRFIRIRHFGLLHSRSKYPIADVIEAIRKSGVGQNSDLAKLPFLSSPKEYVPRCPVCKKGRMLILAIGTGRDPPPDIKAINKLRSAQNRNAVIA